MPRIAILTPDPEDPDFHSRWRQVVERNAAPLERDGFIVESRSWAGSKDLAAFDLVLPLLVWGYPRARPQWLAAVDRWEAEGVRLMNPPPVLRWNSDKAYLERLAANGAPVVPTRLVDRVTEQALANAAAAFGTDRLVAKPRISSSAWRTIRWSPGASLDEGPEGAAMIQPYLPSIESAGEVSLLYFAGRFSHAIRKVPQPGDFRVQPEYDGIITAYAPEPDEFAAADAVLGAVEEQLLYGRVDLVRDMDGRPALIELELIEPDLYLGYDPADGAAFAKAVQDHLSRGA
jgi:glutathione synthase/RimK-type ligase-like ATP-grasp enzyme